MDPVHAAAIAQILSAAIQLWGVNSNKPPGWIPSPEELAAMLKLNEKTSDDYKAEAAALLGIPWPNDPPTPTPS